MAQTQDTGLEARIAELESQVRALRATNLTDRAAIVNPATGLYVPLSALAFGTVAAEHDTDVAGISLDGVANVAGGTGFVSKGGPQLDVYVTGGRLLIQLAAMLTASGNKAGMFYSYGLRGPTTEPSLTGPLVGFNGDTAYSVEAFHNGQGQAQDYSGGSFAIHENLAPGWYHVEARYLLSYSGTTYAPYGIATMPRIAATPY